MKDEILAPVLTTDETAIPRYDIIDQQGNVIATNVTLNLKNEVVQQGTPLTEDTLLKESTAQKLGLTAEDPTVDDALQAIHSVVSETSKIGDIVFSTQNLEEESNGIWIACDQREVLTTAYPELCALPLMRNRFALHPIVMPGTEGLSVYVGSSNGSDRVGDRYIIGQSGTNANWNDYFVVYDLVEKKTKITINGSVSGAYIDDDMTRYTYGSNLRTFIFSKNKEVTKGISGNIYRFGEVYNSVITNSSSTRQHYEIKYTLISNVLESETMLTSSASIVPNQGYELTFKSNANALGRIQDAYTPFNGMLKIHGSKIYALQVIKNLIDSTDVKYALFESSDGKVWAQIYTTTASIGDSTTSGHTFGIVNNKIYICYSLYQVVSQKIETVKSVVEIVDFETNAFIDKVELQNRIFQGSMFVNGNYMYCAVQHYTDPESGGSNTVETIKVNLTTKSVEVLHTPAYMENRIINDVRSTLFPELGDAKISAVSGISESDKIHFISGGFRSTYDLEQNKMPNADTKPFTMVLGDRPIIIDDANRVAGLQFNSNYYFYKGSSTDGIKVFPRTGDAIKTRVLPYIPNAYIKALNEEASE